MTQGQSQNLGQVAGIWISSYAPENIKLIWYDTTEQIHKVYNAADGEWKSLNPQIVTNSNISALRAIALATGLTVGKFYYLTDVGTLAIAITTTKIWYVDSHSNYIVNDLSASIQAYVNSTNLLIDGTTGVWSGGQLKFDFNIISSGSNLQSNNDFVVMRRQNGTTWTWIKTKISDIISAVSGNSITWYNGLYFNFNSAINGIKNRAGGIVGYDAYIDNNNSISQSIAACATDRDEFLGLSKDYTDQETAAEKIYDKAHSEAWTVLVSPPNIPSQTAKLEDILQILVSWANVLQNSDKIKIGSGFSPNGRSGNVNYSDTVRAAIEKLVYKLNYQQKVDGINLPNDFNINGRSGNYLVSDSLNVLLEKIIYHIKDVVCDVRDYETAGAILPQNKIYVYGVYQLECRCFREGNDELPTIVFAYYRSSDSGDSFPYPYKFIVFRMPDESNDYVYSNSYYWSDAPTKYKKLYLQSDADYIKMPSDFVIGGISGDFIATDTLDVFIEKLIYKTHQHNSSDNVSLPSDWSGNTYSGTPQNRDSLSVAIGKLVNICFNLASSNNVKLPDDFDPLDYSGILPTVNDTLTTAIGKICCILNDPILSDKIVLPSNFNTNGRSGNFVTTDSLTYVLEKLIYQLQRKLSTETNGSVSGTITANGFIVQGSAVAGLLKSNGQIDTNTYATVSQLDGYISKAGGGSITNGTFSVSAGTQGDSYFSVDLSGIEMQYGRGLCVLSINSGGVTVSGAGVSLSVRGTVYAADYQTSSDERLKEKVSDVTLTVEQIAAAPSIKYNWKNNANTSLHVGTIAQYWQEVLPEVVSKNNDGYLTLDYASASMVSVISMAKEVVVMKEEIKELKKIINEKFNGCL